MRFFSKICHRFRSLFCRRRVEQELDDELLFHLEKLVEDKVRRGIPPAAARDAALRELGGIDQHKEECRDARRVHLIETLLQDLRYGFRILIRNPGFTAVVALTLALGICSTSSTFSIIDGLFLRPLPAKDPDQLVWIYTGRAGYQGPSLAISYLDYLDLCRQNSAFSAIIASEVHDIWMELGGQKKATTGEYVSENYFSELGIPLALGRAFIPGANGDRYAAPPVVLSYNLWKQWYQSDPGIIGKEIIIDDKKGVIHGIAPPWYSRFHRGRATEAWLPVNAWKSENKLGDRDSRMNFDLLGRLRPDGTVEQARAEMNTIAQQWSDSFPAIHKDLRFSLKKETEERLTALIPTSLIMFGVGMVLVICCANISGMMLARSEARRSEIGVRLAMGAGRRRLVRQLLTESTLPAILGGGLGLLFTYWLLQLHPVLMPSGDFLLRMDVRIDIRVIVFTFGVTMIAALISGMAPALAATRPDLFVTIKKAQTKRKIGKFRLSGRSLILAGQMALSLILLVGAGLFLRCLIAKETANPGFDTSKTIWNVRVKFSPRWVSSQEAGLLRIVERIRMIPGVKNASYSMAALEGQGNSPVEISIPGIDPPAGRKGFLVGYNIVERNYFKTIGKRLLRGHLFESQSETAGKQNIIVNQAMIRRFWPTTDPIGRQIVVGGNVYQVAGVVQDGRDLRNFHKDPDPYIYIQFLPKPVNGGSFVIETTGNSRTIANAIRREILFIDKDASLLGFETLNDMLGRELWVDRMLFLTVGTLGFIGIFLTAVGLYGVVTYMMQRRIQEIGIRLALGARSQDVLWLGLRQGLKVGLIAIPVGLVIAFLMARVLEHTYEGMVATDIVVFLGALGLVLCVTLFASCIPSYRAAKVDPMKALRYE